MCMGNCTEGSTRTAQVHAVTSVSEGDGPNEVRERPKGAVNPSLSATY